MWTRSDGPLEDQEALLPVDFSGTDALQRQASVPTRTPTRPSISLSAEVMHRLLIFMVPSFLTRSHDVAVSRISEKPVLLETSAKMSTEYLDGVRGLASVVVFILHWTHIQFPGVNSGYVDSTHSSIWQLPFIRAIYSGAAMVSIFFAVSGFVLTHRFIQKMHRGDLNSLYPSLTSLTFRRAVRLFLPALASCLLAFLCASLGLISVPKRIDRMPFHHGLMALLQYVDKESDPWTWDPYMKGFYNPQLWSISLEFRGSMVTFLTVLALARSRLAVRMVVESGMVVHAFAHRRWDVALFIAGMLIAELDVLVHESSAGKRFMQKKSTKLVLLVTMSVGVWLSGYPRDNGPKSLGYKLLSQQWPHSGYRRRFWVSIGSILIVGPLPFFPGIQAFFNTRLIRYFGKVSFALYLIHGLGNRTIGTWILRATLAVIGKENFRTHVASYVVSTLVYVPVIFWWSDVFWRAFDVPSTHFAKWMEGKCAARMPS